MKLTPSGSQTVGPFFRLGLEHLCSRRATRIEDAEIVTVHGKVLDGDGVPVPDAVLEIWHADAQGEYSGEFDESGRAVCFTRAATDDQGQFEFTFPKPGVVICTPEFTQAPHVAVLVFARGLLRHLLTRIYLPGDWGNTDTILRMIPQERRATLIARETAGDAHTYEWNVVLQGLDETVFFAW